jgi:hypothetical protein
MADEPELTTFNLARRLRESPQVLRRIALDPDIARAPFFREVPTMTPVAEPAPPSPPAPAPPAPAPPQAPAADPFAELPFPSPGDRIKAEDFRRLSQGLRTIADAYALAGAAFGQPLGAVRTALAAQGYEVARVVASGGAELAAGDTSLDARKVLHVAPLALGQRRVGVVVAEPAEARRQMPNVVGMTYRQAQALIQQQLGDLAAQGGPVTVPTLTGRTLSEAQRAVSG